MKYALVSFIFIAGYFVVFHKATGYINQSIKKTQCFNPNQYDECRDKLPFGDEAGVKKCLDDMIKKMEECEKEN